MSPIDARMALLARLDQVRAEIDAIDRAVRESDLAWLNSIAPPADAFTFAQEDERRVLASLAEHGAFDASTGLLRRVLRRELRLPDRRFEGALKRLRARGLVASMGGPCGGIWACSSREGCERSDVHGGGVSCDVAATQGGNQGGG